MVKELKVVYNQIKDYNPNFTINKDALKIIDLDLEITYNNESKNYKVIDNNTGKEYFNRITYPDCNGCKFNTAEEVVRELGKDNSQSVDNRDLETEEEITSLQDDEAIEEIEEFESKNYDKYFSSIES